MEKQGMQSNGDLKSERKQIPRKATNGLAMGKVHSLVPQL